jgi:hypothetical protein
VRGIRTILVPVDSPGQAHARGRYGSRERGVVPRLSRECPPLGWTSPARAAAIRSLPTAFTLRDLRSCFLLDRERVRGLGLEIFYAPFDWINPDALVVFIGITPDW